MFPSSIIIGDGITGLLLACSLRKRGWDVTVIGKASSQKDDSPLICPEIVMEYLKEISVSSETYFLTAGARRITHQELLRQQFPDSDVMAPGDPAFFFMSRKLMLQFLETEAASLGVRRIHNEVLSISLRDMAKEVACSERTFIADFIFDCTGSRSPRKNWLNDSEIDLVKETGLRDQLFYRFYHSDSPVHPCLTTYDGIRGGIYPLENNRFVISLFLPASRSVASEEIDGIAEGFLRKTRPGKPEKSQSDSPWIRQDHIQNAVSDFYLRDEGPQGFFPVGDGVLYNNPVYGRGIALSVLQIRPLMEQIDSGKALSPGNVRGAMIRGFRDAHIKWKETTPRFRFPAKFARLFIEKNPRAYSSFLEFYQLRITPGKLIAKLLM